MPNEDPSMCVSYMFRSKTKTALAFASNLNIYFLQNIPNKTTPYFKFSSQRHAKSGQRRNDIRMDHISHHTLRLSQTAADKCPG